MKGKKDSFFELTNKDVNVFHPTPCMHICEFLLEINKHHSNTVVRSQINCP